MKKTILSVCMFFMLAGVLNAQSEKKEIYLPKFVVKTNALYWATTTPNLGFEIGLNKKFTLDVSGNYNPWKFSSDKHIKHWLVQPELRYWLCERFNGHFFGLHGHYAEFNVDGFKFLKLKNNHYQGELYGGGISYGYNWILSNRWAIEATIGAGYARVEYDKSACETCISRDKNYWGPTKIGLNIIYVIK